MAAWFIPALKAILPHVGSIVSVALPVFTTRKADEAAAAQASIVQQQITELQTAVSDNATHIKALAQQLQQTVTALQQAAALAEIAQRRLFLFSVVTMVVALMAVTLSVVTVLW